MTKKQGNQKWIPQALMLCILCGSILTALAIFRNYDEIVIKIPLNGGELTIKRK